MWLIELQYFVALGATLGVMNVEASRYMEGVPGSLLDESALTTAAARELTSPLVLLRQLALALNQSDLSETERAQLNERIALTTERALRLTTSLSMASGGQSVLPLEPINPIYVCQEVIHELSPLFQAHGRSITLQSRTRIPLLVGNRQVLQRILLSFGDNALHYGSTERPVRMTISGHGSRVRIGIRDYGPTLPANIWDQLEGRVTRRAPVPLPSRPHTSGVGLIAAKRLAELMESTVGLIRHRDGATFYVDLHISRQMSLLPL